MLHIVYGGSASGKSSYAESIAMSLQGDGRLLYIAAAICNALLYELRDMEK